MPKENQDSTKTAEQETVAAEEGSHAALDTAVDEIKDDSDGDTVNEEITEEKTQTEEIPDEKAVEEPQENLEIGDPGQLTEEKIQKHKDKSALGRKFASFEKEVGEKFTKLDNFTGTLEQFLKKQGMLEIPEIDEDLDAPMTRRELQLFLTNKENKQIEDNNKYNNNYKKTIEDLYISDNSGVKEGILDEFETNFNYQHSNDPGRDARENYLKAENAYLKKYFAKPKQKENPVRGEIPRSPLGSTTKQIVASKSKVMPKMDSMTASLAKHMNNDELVKQTIGI